MRRFFWGFPIKRKKFVYLCTNALLLKRKIDMYEPSPYLTFSIHLDGNEEQHDRSVCQDGVFDKAVAAIKMAIDRGFRVNVNATLFSNESPTEVADFFDYATTLGVEHHQVGVAIQKRRLPGTGLPGND